jgi:DNA-binding MarR family transcriptional regulator/ribosomal protein S18 acetylase RimI-like enzyme
MVEQVRRFNRTVTQRVGALNDMFLSRRRPLGEARVLWEIGAAGADLRELRARLDLDSGYLSRILRALEADGLVAVGPSPVDGRVRIARLTDAGADERSVLDQLANQAAADILAPLSPRQQSRLVAAMADVEQLMTASMVEIVHCDPAESVARICIEAYFSELNERFPAGFDPGRSISADDHELRPPGGLLLVAILHGNPVGCGALKLHPSAPAEIKRMWVSPTVRGLGLGRRLLAELEARAVAAGATAARLETNESLTEAIALYRASGYRATRSTPVTGSRKFSNPRDWC